jgi:hypothetical protein
VREGPWWAGVGSAACVMPLTDGHRLLWRRGAVVACDHDAGDVVLGALGDTLCPCLLVVQACRPSPLDDRLLPLAELLDRLGGLSPHLGTGKADVVTATGDSDDPVRRRNRALAAVHLLDRPVLDRVVLGRLVGLERRLPVPGTRPRWALEAALGVRASRAARTAFGPLARGRMRVMLQLCEPDEEPYAALEAPSAVRLVLAPSWLRTVWWPGKAVRPGGQLLLSEHHAVRLERRRTGPVVVDVPLDL